MARDSGMELVIDRVDPEPYKPYTVKDSGARQQFSTGMVRDIEDNKIDYSLVLDGPMFKRWAEHITKGAQKYQAKNWLKAETEEEQERFKRSAVRHFFQWLSGEDDEDHLAASWFNANGYEMVKDKRRNNGS